MSIVINRTTGKIKYSVHTPDYTRIDWIINPVDLGIIQRVPVHYRVIENDTVREATIGEKLIIDNSRLSIYKYMKRDAIGKNFMARLLATEVVNLTVVLATTADTYKQIRLDIEAASTLIELYAVSTEI